MYFPYKKIDLHLHLDGSLSYACLNTLALESGISLLEQELISVVTVNQNCTSLVEYLKCFDLPTKLLQTERSLTFAAFDLIQTLETQSLYYAEIRFAPQLHTLKGLTQQQAIEAVLKAVDMAKIQNLKVKIGIILCMMVTGSDKANLETAELAVAYQKKGVVGLDLAGAEGAVPLIEFQPLFQIAYKNNLPFTIHAGECGDYENIKTAISYGTKRIGHGCAARFSKECMNLIKNEGIVLEMCPTSNIQTKAVSDFHEHPIKLFFDKGILVTVNTDNMTVSNTTLDKEYDLLKSYFKFTDSDIKTLNENAEKAAFSDIF